MAEQAESPCGRLRGVVCLALIEDVHVFVERCAVTDLDLLVNRERTLGHGAEEVAMGRQQDRCRPVDRLSGNLIESFGAFQAGRDLVMIAPNDRGVRDGANALGDLIRVGAVPDEISEHQHAVNRRGRTCRQYGLQRLKVSMHVAEDQVSHQ